MAHGARLPVGHVRRGQPGGPAQLDPAPGDRAGPSQHGEALSVPVAIATQLNSIVHPFPVPSIIGSHQCDRNTVEFEFPFETRLR